VDVTAVNARLAFDCRTHQAMGEASVQFVADDRTGVFDLRQRIEAATLDGLAVDAERLRPNADGIRSIETAADGAEHELWVRYPIDTPACTDAVPLGWTRPRPGILFDLWMSDLYPGRYLEMWIPSPLCEDRFALQVDVEIEGAGPHTLFANGDVSGTRVRYPDTFTSLSPMLVIAPDERYDLISSVEDGITVDTFKFAGPEIDLAACHVTVAECLAHNRERFGPYCHGSRFLTYVWGSTRGMEYDGATTASVGSLEHEVFHSWFGRGVKPAEAADGWIDEAFTTWYTSAPPRPRQWAQPFDWSEPPVLLCPPSPWARATPREAYTSGARLFAGVAAVIGVEGLCDVMAGVYREHASAFLSTDDLQATLTAAAGPTIEPAFARWVHAR